MPDFPTKWIREQFPALNDGEEFVFFDNGAGAQVPRVVLDAVQDHLISRNVQRGGRYRRSVEVDGAIQRARESVALFVNASEPNEIAFGMNATSFIRIVSLALGETLGARNEIVVSDLDHEANIATWLALERSGARIRWWHMRDDATLNIEDLEPLLNRETHGVPDEADLLRVRHLDHAMRKNARQQRLAAVLEGALLEGDHCDRCHSAKKGVLSHP